MICSKLLIHLQEGATKTKEILGKLVTSIFSSIFWLEPEYTKDLNCFVSFITRFCD